MNRYYCKGTIYVSEVDYWGLYFSLPAPEFHAAVNAAQFFLAGMIAANSRLGPKVFLNYISEFTMNDMKKEDYYDVTSCDKSHTVIASLLDYLAKRA